MKVLLLASGDEKAPVAAVDGTLKLLRLVVSVEKYEAADSFWRWWRGSCGVSWCLRSKEAGRSHGMLDFGFCKMEIEVACSLFPKYTNEFLHGSKGSGEAGLSAARSNS
ncbi:hypothetical protein ZWY2020_047994 [Hordeum vulgare]|nr:hypothetical protein ZWY2020_047994 [Hordeum vulgare]